MLTNITDNIVPGWDKNFQPVNDGLEPEPGAPINILLMGSDTREGIHHYGNPNEIKGARSDTTILLHISGDRKRALAVSIPRDSLVTLPMCTNAQGVQEGGQTTRFNEAFDIGGPGCTAKAVTQLTGIPIDHYVVVNFEGFKNVVDALDGVDVCLTEAVDDPNSKLKLPKGHSTVRGDDALAFVRARETLGDGSDIDRIHRQQEFLSSAIRKATSAGVVLNPAQLYSVLDATTKSLTTDPGLAQPDALRKLAVNMSDIKPSNITFATVPFVYNSDFNTVSWDPNLADELWDAMRYDRQWPPPPTNGADGQPLHAAPSTITVNVLNGSGTVGKGTIAATDLGDNGYEIGTIDSTKTQNSTILYDPEDADQVEAARTLEIATGATVTPKAGANLTLIVGPDYRGSIEGVVTTPKKKGPNPAPTSTTQTPAEEQAHPTTAEEEVCSLG